MCLNREFIADISEAFNNELTRKLLLGGSFTVDAGSTD